MKINKLIIGSTAMLVAATMAGCAHKAKPATFTAPVEKVRPNLVAQATKDLRNAGIKVVVTGETVRIVVPNKMLFKPGTAHIVANGREILSSVQEYLDNAEVIAAQVATYAHRYPAGKAQRYLATKRSRHIIMNLGDNDVDVRLLTAEGDVRYNPKMRGQLKFTPSAYNGLTIFSFTTQPNHWIAP